MLHDTDFSIDRAGGENNFDSGQERRRSCDFGNENSHKGSLPKIWSPQPNTFSYRAIYYRLSGGPKALWGSIMTQDPGKVAREHATEPENEASTWGMQQGICV